MKTLDVMMMIYHCYLNHQLLTMTGDNPLSNVINKSL